jgi:RsiW-degrading membrane proteinase PrsW (M82 family)
MKEWFKKHITLKFNFKEIVRRIQLWDFFWSFPLSMLLFYGYGYIQEIAFNDPMYSTEWIHKTMLATVIMILANGFIQLGMWFNFRGIYKYFYSKTSSIRDDYKQLPIWIKVYTFLFIYFLQFLVFILIFQAI